MSPIIQNQTVCVKGNNDTRGKKCNVSGSHTSEISIQQFSSEENSCASWLDLRVELPAWHTANTLNSRRLLLLLVGHPPHMHKAETNQLKDL